MRRSSELGKVISSPLALYGVINAVAAGCTFLLLPVLLRLFEIEEFGRWALVEPIVFFGTTLVLLGAEHGVMKQIVYDGDEPRVVTGALALTGLPVLILGGLVVAAMAWPLVGAEAVKVGLLVFAEGVIALLLASARAAGRTGAFALGHIARVAVVLAIAVAALVQDPSRRWEVGDFLDVRLLVAAGVTVVVASLLRPRFRISMCRYADAVRYGVFILGTSLLNMALDVMDRYFLAAFHDLSVVASYTVHVKIASLIAQGIVMPFSLWFAPERLKRMQEPDAGASFFNNTATGLLVVCCFIGGATFLASPWIFAIVAPGIDVDPWVLGPLLAAASAVGMSYALNVGLLKPGRTHLNLVGIAVGLAITALFSLVLAEVYGALGVAVAKLLGTLAFTAILARLSQREHPVMFRYERMLLAVLATGVLIVIVQLLIPSTNLPATIARITGFTVLGAICLCVSMRYVVRAKAARRSSLSG